MGFWLLSSSFVFLLGCGSGLTIFKFHHIAKSQNVISHSMATALRLTDCNKNKKPTLKIITFVTWKKLVL